MTKQVTTARRSNSKPRYAHLLLFRELVALVGRGFVFLQWRRLQDSGGHRGWLGQAAERIRRCARQTV